jgi:hypothetical protein
MHGPSRGLQRKLGPLFSFLAGTLLLKSVAGMPPGSPRWRKIDAGADG